MLLKQEPITLQKLASFGFWRITNSVFNKIGNLLYLLRCWLLHLIKQNCAKNFSKNSSLDDSGIPLSAYPYRTNLKLHNIRTTPKYVKIVVTNLYSPKACGLNCVLLVILKK